MSGIRPAIIVAMCGCEEVLVKDNIYSKEYWTKYGPYVDHAKQLLERGVNIKSAKCPGCGGDNKIKMGSYFHPSYATQ